MAMRPNRPVPAADPSRLVLSLDTLTDGSERTGHGAIFLSIRKGPKQPTVTNAVANDSVGLERLEGAVDDSDPAHSVLARYAISGLPTLTARLCADQRLHLASTRAVFLPNLDPASIVGIPSLLLALNNAGSAKVFVAGPRGVDAYVERNVDLVLGRYKTFPATTTCEVPSSSGGLRITNKSDCWWEVFEDEYILVYAKYVDLKRAKERIDDDDDDDDDDGDDDDESSAGDGGSSSSSCSSSSGDASSTSDEEGDTPHCRGGSNIRESLSVAYIFHCKGVGIQFAILPPNLDPSSPLISASMHPLPEAVSRSSLSPAASDANYRPFSSIIFLSPHIAAAGLNEDKMNIAIHTDLKAISQSFISTVPGKYSSWDEGILVRASNQARKLHRDLPFAFAANNQSIELPVFDSESSGRLELDRAGIGISRLRSCSSMIIWYGQHDNPVTNVAIDRRRCIMSRVLEKKSASNPTHSSSNGTEGTAICEESRDESSNSEIAELAKIYSRKGAKEVTDKVSDGNEISLDDDDEDSVDECSDDNEKSRKSCEQISADASGKDGLDPTRAHLLVLGTGCASPSPLRGSSGYGILLPSWQQSSHNGNQRLCLSGLLECGEGSLLALRRHLPSDDVLNGPSLDEWLRQIRFIWISHAHLDHYSELPLMIRSIATAGGRQVECNCSELEQTPSSPEGNAHMRSPGENTHMRSPSQLGAPLWCSKCLFPPIIIAPPKVLQFLEASLACNEQESETQTNSASRKRKHEDIRGRVRDRLYFGVSNQDFDRSPFASTLRQMLFSIEIPKSSSSFYRPFASLLSVPVTHCPQAFAVILDLRVSNDNKPFFLVYSGDTRPSESLVQACRRAIAVTGGGGLTSIDLLIHETTFDDDEQGKQNAIVKRHSTVLEAIEVAKQTKAKCCLFTHFSQRYPNLPESASIAGVRRSLPVLGGQGEDEIKLCAAIDGMTLPLTESRDVFTRLNRCCQASCLGH